MALPNTPQPSEHPAVKELFESKNISVQVLAENIDIQQLKDIARNHPQGVLVIVTNDYSDKYKVICLNALSLHYCVIEQCLIEVKLDGRQMWRHYLSKVQYFDFLPCDKSEDIDVLKDELCSHLANLLLREVKVSFSRGAKYFFELNIPEMPSY
jgi:hypothetical protein